MKIIDLDIIFISYDEPNADLNYADLCNKAPWSKRIHGCKGSDAAHKKAALLSETEWFISVDADNIVDQRFFDLELDDTDNTIKVYSWLGRNVINDLQYGNGGLKVWNKKFALEMKTHESSVSKKSQVDFCWEDGYKQFMTCYSDVVINGSPFQAWRAGFREGVKMTLVDGIKVDATEILEKVWWHNLHRLKIWSTVGSHIENGIYAILGARMGAYMTNCTEWNYVEVRDFDVLKEIYESKINHNQLEQDAREYGLKIRQQIGLDLPWLDIDQSKYTSELYRETINLCKTYYRN